MATLDHEHKRTRRNLFMQNAERNDSSWRTRRDESAEKLYSLYESRIQAGVTDIAKYYASVSVRRLELILV